MADQDSTEQRILQKTLADSLDRAAVLSHVLAFAFSVYAFNSLEFIKRFDPEVSLLSNLLPRLLLGTLPFWMLGLWLRRSHWSPVVRLVAWSSGFAALMQAASWIHVWPLALQGNASILMYVQPANVFLVAAVYSTVAPPVRCLPAFSAAIGLLFYLPLLVVGWVAGDLVLFRAIAGDSFTVLVLSLFLSTLVDRLRRRIAALELDREQQASKFLGPHLSKAIYADESHRLDRVRCRGFVLSVDIRDSTEMQKKHGEGWLLYRSEYFKLVAQLASRYSGHIQKTVGDCHVINFGVMDYGVDLSDIPGIEPELERAEEARLQRASDAVFAFVEELFKKNDQLSRAHFHGRAVSLGAGVDKGWVERAVHGDEAHQLELDVNGDPVNCSNRLQEYSKVLRQDRGWSGSVLVAAPFACDYLASFESFQRVTVGENPVRNYPGIRWVLVRIHELGNTEAVDDPLRSKRYG